jgi:hypothetical protein
MFASAKSVFESGRYEEAYGIYVKLWASRQTYDIAANLAQAELELGKRRDAAEHIAYALRAFPMSSGRERRAALERELAGLRKDLGVVRIQVTVEGAEVLIDGRPIGKAPIPGEVFVDPGARVIEARHPGYEDARKTIEVAREATADVTLDPAKARDKPPAPPPAPPPPAVGQGYAPVIFGGAVSALLLGTAIGLTVAANGEDADADAKLEALKAAGVLCPGPEGCAELKTLRGNKDTYHNLAVAAYGGSGLALAGTILYLVYRPTGSEAPQAVGVRPAIVVGPARQGIWLTGSF